MQQTNAPGAGWCAKRSTASRALPATGLIEMSVWVERVVHAMMPLITHVVHPASGAPCPQPAAGDDHRESACDNTVPPGGPEQRRTLGDCIRAHRGRGGA